VKRVLFGAGLLLGAGCTGGTETGNPVVQGTLSYTGYSSAPERFGVGEGGDIATIRSAWFNLEALTVSVAGCGSQEGEAFTVAALGLGDHAAGAHVSTPFEARPGAFCSVQLPFVTVPADATAGPPQVRGHALLLTGALADGTEYSIVSDTQPVVELQAPVGGFALSSGRADVLVAFDFSTWLQDLDLAGANLTDGNIVVSAESNQDLLATFEASLSAGVALYRDAGADGVLDDNPELLAAP
jgi:hypothetical protein